MTEIINDYIKMRNSKNIFEEWFKRYFLDVTGKNVSSNYVLAYLQFSNHNEIFNHLDKKFNLDTLHDRNGNFLKCYPGSN
jgi:hypothetical protein